MADVLYVVMLFVLTAIGVLFVVGCDKIVGSDELELVQDTGPRHEPFQEQSESLAA